MEGDSNKHLNEAVFILIIHLHGVWAELLEVGGLRTPVLQCPPVPWRSVFWLRGEQAGMRRAAPPALPVPPPELWLVPVPLVMPIA